MKLFPSLAGLPIFVTMISMRWFMSWTGVMMGWFCAHSASPVFQLTQGEVQLRYLRYEFAVHADDRGVPVMDWKRFRASPEHIVKRPRRSIVLENDHLRATLIPSMGRLHSLVNPLSGREQLWINPIAVPLGANNDTGFWMTWGGIEHVMPSREHGTSHALSWTFEVEENTSKQKSVRMESTEPLTGLHHAVIYTLYPDQPFLETRILIRNPHAGPVRFSHWTTATLAPGGGTNVTPHTELVVPAARFVPDDRDFNDWMQGLTGPTATSPLRFVGKWQSIGDLMTTPLQQGFYGVYARERREGILRSFPLDISPGFDIWGWGYPPTEKRQREFTRGLPNMGYIELWNGNAHGFSDEDLSTVKGGQTLEWVERLWVVSQLEDPLRASMKSLLIGP